MDAPDFNLKGILLLAVFGLIAGVVGAIWIVVWLAAHVRFV